MEIISWNERNRKCEFTKVKFMYERGKCVKTRKVMVDWKITGLDGTSSEEEGGKNGKIV